MIRKLAGLAGLAVFCVFTFTSTASAQHKTQQSITLNIPFEFSVGNRMLPAGSYKLDAVLGPPTEADNMSILALRSVEGHLYHVVVTDVAEGVAKSNATVVFAYRGGQRCLSQVWLSGRHVGLSVRASQASGQVLEAREEGQLVELSAPILNR